MATHAVASEFNSHESWSILTDIEKSIKAKIEAVGTPLKDWDVSINYGIKTGFNDAFIIDSAKREQILSNCLTDEERERTEAIIRPILRGRDIKRYSYDFADQYIIATFPSRQYNIEDYQALKSFLLCFGKERLEQTGKEYVINGEKVKSRKKTNNKWFETQDSIGYWDLLVQPKIIWGEISDRSKFCLDEKGIYFPEATTFMLSGEQLPYLLAFLNCNVSEYIFSLIGTTTGVGTVRWKKYKILELPVPKKLQKEQYDAIVTLCNKIINTQDGSIESTPDIEKLNELINNVYGLSDEEVLFINSHLRK